MKKHIIIRLFLVLCIFCMVSFAASAAVSFCVFQNYEAGMPNAADGFATAGTGTLNTVQIVSDTTQGNVIKISRLDASNTSEQTGIRYSLSSYGTIKQDFTVSARFKLELPANQNEFTENKILSLKSGSYYLCDFDAYNSGICAMQISASYNYSPYFLTNEQPTAGQWYTVKLVFHHNGTNYTSFDAYLDTDSDGVFNVQKQGLTVSTDPSFAFSEVDCFVSGKNTAIYSVDDLLISDTNSQFFVSKPTYSAVSKKSSYTVGNILMQDATAAIITILYETIDGLEYIEDIKIHDVETIHGGESKLYTESFVPDDNNGSHVRVYLWDSVQGMQLLSPGNDSQ